MNVNIAVVNSKSFGRYTNAVEELKKLGRVEFIEVPKDINGKELAKVLNGFQFVIASVTPYYSAEFFDLNNDVLMIVRHGIGVDNIDLQAAERHGVVVARVPGYVEREAVAEHTAALMISALRMVPQSYIAVKEGRWGDRAKFIGRELPNLTVGVIGFGNIGSRVAEILAKGFNAKIVVYDPYVSKETVEALGYRYVSDLKELFKVSDIVTLHAALTKENYHMVNKDVLFNAKEGIIIVNTARGELIDEQALCEALDKGIVSAVAMDVVEGEPISAEHRLLKYNNVIITPHIAAYTWEALKGMDMAMVYAIKNFIDGKPIDGVVVLPKNLRRRSF